MATHDQVEQWLVEQGYDFCTDPLYDEAFNDEPQLDFWITAFHLLCNKFEETFTGVTIKSHGSVKGQRG